MSKSSRPTLGALMQAVRSRHGWTLKEMSRQTGIPLSTLAKVEHDRLTLTYDKLLQVSERLNIRLSELFAEESGEAEPVVTARRSVSGEENTVRIETANYDYYYLCTELRRKRMIPILTRIRTRTLEEFGALVRHSGEEFIYVLEGRLIVHSEFYDPVTLEPGRGIYLDSSMGHAYLVAEGCEEAVAICVCSSADDDLMESLLQMHD